MKTKEIKNNKLLLEEGFNWQEKKTSQLRINGKGDFLKLFKHPNRLKNINIFFSDRKINWNDEVYQSLPTRIGVYAIIDNKNDIIYVGKATGVEGLRGRHRDHEKNLLFRLFNAKEMIIYYAEKSTKDDPGIVVLLERIMIYGHEPVLNNDVKGSIPINYLISEQMIKKLDKMIVDYEVNGSDEEKAWLDYIYEELEEKTKNSKDAKEKYEEAVRENYNNTKIRDRKKSMTDTTNVLTDFINENLESVLDFPSHLYQ